MEVCALRHMLVSFPEALDQNFVLSMMIRNFEHVWQSLSVCAVRKTYQYYNVGISKSSYKLLSHDQIIFNINSYTPL